MSLHQVDKIKHLQGCLDKAYRMNAERALELACGWPDASTGNIIERAKQFEAFLNGTSAEPANV